MYESTENEGAGTAADETPDVSFEIVAFAGNARCTAMMAVEAAREGDFEQADRYLEEAQRDHLRAHEVQTHLLTRVARGDEIVPNLLMVHAQDHLTMASVAMDDAREFVHLYHLLDRLGVHLSSEEEPKA